jgi:Hormone receptor domain
MNVTVENYISGLDCCQTVVCVHLRYVCSSTETIVSWCPRLWDNVTCWPETPPGILAVEPCPTHFDGIQLFPGDRLRLLNEWLAYLPYSRWEVADRWCLRTTRQTSMHATAIQCDERKTSSNNPPEQSVIYSSTLRVSL